MKKQRNFTGILSELGVALIFRVNATTKGPGCKAALLEIGERGVAVSV